MNIIEQCQTYLLPEICNAQDPVNGQSETTIHLNEALSDILSLGRKDSVIVIEVVPP